MVIDSHEHMMLPTEMQLQMMDKAGIDKTILFCTAPHPEKASSLNEIETEMAALYKVLSGSNNKEADLMRQQKNICCKEISGSLLWIRICAIRNVFQ